jgi:predicted ATP-binding protein involved in virulence
MQLDFLWIRNFRVLKDIGINFSTQREFSFDFSSKQLTLTSHPNPLNEFFGSNISEVTAIIGKNGSGKSTLFDFINRNLSGHANGGASFYDDGDFIAVFSDIIFVSSYELIANQERYRDRGYRFVAIDSSQALFRSTNPEGEDTQTEYNKFKYIYYSNVFDLKVDYSDPNNLIDISTNSLLLN